MLYATPSSQRVGTEAQIQIWCRVAASTRKVQLDLRAESLKVGFGLFPRDVVLYRCDPQLAHDASPCSRATASSRTENCLQKVNRTSRRPSSLSS